MKDLFKITKERLKNHFHYGKWYYVVAIIFAVALVNIVLTVTQPQYPRESRISITMYGGVADEIVTQKWKNEILEILPDNQRQVDIISSANADGSADMVIVARMAATDDDIIILSTEDMKNYAAQGAFVPLDDLIGREKIKELLGVTDLSKYEMFVEGAPGDQIYYLPLNQVEGFDEIGLNGDNLSIGILMNSTNVQNAVICFEYIMTR